MIPEAFATPDINFDFSFGSFCNRLLPPPGPSASCVDPPGPPELGDGQFFAPQSIALDASGNIYVVDDNGFVQKFDSTGEFLLKVGNGACSSLPGFLCQPRGLAVDSSGRIYVADSSNNRIQIFNQAGTLLHNFGTFGTTVDGQFGVPLGIDVDDSTGNFHVVDQNSLRVQTFTLASPCPVGTTQIVSGVCFVSKFNTSGSFGGKDVIVDESSGNIIVGKPNNIEVYDSSGTLQFTASSGIGVAQGVGLDSSGNIYVADPNNNQIHIFDSAGTFLTEFGSTGTGDGFFRRSVDVTTGSIIVVDSENNRIQVFSDPVFAAPDAINDLSATAISLTQIDLSWSTPNDNDAQIAGYRIERESPTGGIFSVIEASFGDATTTSYSDTGLNSNTEYNYRISAINPIGTAVVSNEASETTLNNPPVANDDSITAPQNGQITADVLFNDSDADGDTIRISSVSDPPNGVASISAKGTLLTTISDPTPTTSGFFGEYVAISKDFILVTGGDEVHVYDTTGSFLRTLTSDNPASTSFGFTPSIVGNTIAIGEAAAAAFLFDGTTGSQILKITNPDGLGFLFARAVDLDNNLLVVGAPGKDVGHLVLLVSHISII